MQGQVVGGIRPLGVHGPGFGVEAPREEAAKLLPQAEQVANVLEEGLTDSLAGPHAQVHDAGGDLLLHAEVAAECGDVGVDPDLVNGLCKVAGV